MQLPPDQNDHHKKVKSMRLTIPRYFATIVMRWRRLVPTVIGMIALTACTPTQPQLSATPVPSAPIQVEVTASPVGVLSLPGQRVQQLVMDDTFVYWVGLPEGRFLYRAPLHSAVQSAEIKVVAESRYPQGVLLQLPLTRSGDWLIFFDSATPAISAEWMIRRLNVVTGVESTLVESRGEQLAYGFALNDEYAAWSILDHNSNRTCQDEAVLILAKLDTGQQTELDRACFSTEHSWSSLAFSGDTLIATLLDTTVEDAPWGQVARFDLASGQPVTYTIISDQTDEQQTNFRPQAVGDWITWSRGEENFGEPVLLHLRTMQTATLPIAAATAPCQYLQVTERWIAGYDCIDHKHLLLYDPVQRLVVRLQTNNVLYISVVTSAGSRVAVARAVEPDTGKLNSVIEWYNLPSPEVTGDTQRPWRQEVPPLTDLEAAKILFNQRPLPIGELETTFRQQLTDGYFQDYTRQDVDVNGDGQPEILISGHISVWYLYFAILGYTAQGWQEWLYTTADSKYCGDVRPTVTTDQITVDFLTCSGGTGVFDLAWEQHWVQCGTASCAVVWSAPLLRTERLVVWQTARTYEVATVEHPDPTTIRLTTQRFGVSSYPYPDTPSHQPGTAQRSQGPTTVDIYQWDGQRYHWQSRDEQTSGLTIQDQFDLMTQETYDLVWQQLYKAFEKPDGQLDGEGLEQAITTFWQLPPADATSGWAAPHRRLAAAAHTGTPQALGEWIAGLVGTAEPFVCHLSLHHYTAEQLPAVAQQTVPCTRNFSRLAWVDLTGDGQDELLLLTIPPAGEADTNVESSAGMQRLHIYAVADKLTELAVIDGYVNGPDGAGIHWRAGDGAGVKPEVWAGLPLAPLTDPIGWPDRTRRFQLYRWDAEQRKLVADPYVSDRIMSKQLDILSKTNSRCSDSQQDTISNHGFIGETVTHLCES